jgi:hypothetical protein
MKMIKNIIEIGTKMKQRFFCKHLESSISSCPFTEKTYTTCLNCFKKINVEVTK